MTRLFKAWRCCIVAMKLKLRTYAGEIWKIVLLLLEWKIRRVVFFKIRLVFRTVKISLVNDVSELNCVERGNALKTLDKSRSWIVLRRPSGRAFLLALKFYFEISEEKSSTWYIVIAICVPHFSVLDTNLSMKWKVAIRNI